MDSELKFITKTSYDGDYSIAAHTHPCYELVYYLDGTGESVVDKRRYTFTKDTFVLVKPGTIHSECSDKNASVLFVGFTTDYDSLTEGIYSVNTAPVRELMDEILRERENKRPYYKSMLNLLVEKLVLLLLRFPINDRVEKVSFDDILTYIKMNANKNISIQQMASDLGYSYDYFRQFFIEHAGVSAKKYLTDIKLTNVRELLLSTDFSVNKIARITGFSSPSHLCAVFKEALGLTPNDYRKNHLNDTFYDNMKKNVDE